jgi:dTDP-4-amino-4,6-dideoxygalactose transaminase
MTVAIGRRIGVGEVRLSAQAKANVNDALDHDRLSYGKWSRQFEDNLCRIQHHTFACFMNSGTSALQVGLAAMKEHYRWADGMSVLVPALTFVATLNVVLQNNLTPVLVDVDPDYYDMDVYSIPDGRGAAVGMLPVSLFGQPYNEQLSEVARLRNWRVLHDSCETMFVGSPHADVACYSTYACHLINTGVGGFAATDDPDLARLIRSLANHGRSGIYTGIDTELGQKEVMDARFTFERPGYSYRATELEAAIGCAEIDARDADLAARRRHAAVLTAALSGLPLELPKERVAGDHAYMMYPIVCDDGVDRDALTRHLEANGIETRPMLPLTSQPYVRAVFPGPYPVADRINRQGFYVGSHPYLTDDDVNYMVDTFRSFSYWRQA